MRICKNCGSVIEKHTCKVCNRIAVKKYRETHREERNKASKKRRDANPEKAKQQTMRWRDKNKQRVSEYMKIWIAANKERVAKNKRVWGQKNKERKYLTHKNWVLANPDRMKIHGENRRAKKELTHPGKLSVDLSEKLFKLQRGKCACCGLPLGDDYHMDHIMPLALLGENEDSNIQLLRKKCNHEKHAKHPIDFMQSRGFLL